jgi:hypothetical protein
LPALSTISLDFMVRYVRRFVFNNPLTFSGTNDPAMDMGNWVRNTILQPPFAWRWNRATTQITLVTGQQDYSANLPNFGWLESATVVDTVSVPNAVYKLQISLNDETEIVDNQPSKIAARLDDGNGNITFRITPPPTANFTLANLTYQNASPKFAKMSDTWAPIPDYFSNIIQTGLLAKAYEFCGDERYAPTLQMFVRSLIGANGGLTQTQVNIFAQEMGLTPLTMQNMNQNAGIANQSRSLM